MISPNLSLAANHLWQSTVFVGIAWLLTLALRRNRANVRYGVWLAASVKFLIPFSLLVTLGSSFEWRSAPAIPLPHAVEQVTEPFGVPDVALPATASTASPNPAPLLAFAVWLCGVAVCTTFWFRHWRRLRAILRSATPLPLDFAIPVMSTPARLEPGVFGIRKPVLLLPHGIAKRLAPSQLQAILAHELCHVRRRDNLAAAAHMAVQSLFWFHPAVWWIGACLLEERERACDEDVLRLGNEPEAYAEGILNVCKFYLQSPLPVASGVSGADLKRRIAAILANRIAPRLSGARKLLLATAAVAAVATPLLIGLWRAPSSYAQSNEKNEKLVFAVASIKRMEADAGGGGPIPLAPGMTPGGGIRSQVSIFRLMCWAYHIDASQLSGGPSWVRNDRYVIEAKPEKFEGPEDPTAPISEQRANRIRERVKALLAERFHLIVRTETKEAEVYVLSVAKGGFKLTPLPERLGGVKIGAGVIESQGAPFSFLVVPLTQLMGRPVLDETGIDGFFKYKVEFRIEDSDRRALAAAGEPVANDDPHPSIFTALRAQLGLDLKSRKGPVVSVIIERIERPTEN